MIFQASRTFLFVLFLAVWTGLDTAAAQAVLPSKENFHLFLLAGQSNMAGRGTIAPEDSIPHSRVLTLNKENTWVPAIDPIHFDKSSAGVCLGRAFGIALAEANPEITIGLIPCAAGGSPVAVWQPGREWKQTHSKPYDDAIRRTRRAMQDGILKGILWHQGESDSNEELAPRYRAALTDLITRFRTDLGSPRVPFIIGQLGQFPSNPWGEYQQMVDTAHRRVAGEVPLAGFVSSEGLTCNSDNIHFDAKSLREIGRRYAAVYLNVSSGR
jgi:hypothetical protein